MLHIKHNTVIFPYSLSLLLSLDHNKNVSLAKCRESRTPYVMFDIEEYSVYRARCNAWCSYYSLSCFNENQIKFMFLLLGNLLRLYLHFPFPLLPFLIHSNHILLCSFFYYCHNWGFFSNRTFVAWNCRWVCISFANMLQFKVSGSTFSITYTMRRRRGFV